MAITLDESHKKIIEITLWMLDEMLCKFDRWVSSKEFRSVLYEEVNPLSAKQRDDIKNEIIESRALLEKLRDDLGLRKHSEPINKVISAMSAIFAADDLITIKGRKIEAYGAAPADLTDYLEVKIEELITRLHKISSIASHGAESVNREGGVVNKD
jgi:hypothetical protein